MLAPALPAPPPFVGRVTERTAYQRLLRDERGPWLLDISGQGGNGKSRLLQQLQVETPDGWRVGLLNFAIDHLRTDPLRVAKELAEILRPLAGDPNHQQFRQVYERGRDRLSQFSISLQQELHVGADAQAQGISQSINTASAVNEIRRQVQEQVTDALLDLASTARSQPLVLLLDTCEWLREPGSQDVGDWLVNDLLPRLRERLYGGLRAVAAGREPLRTNAAAGEVHRLLLGLLPFPDVDDYLRQIGIADANLRQAAYAMTRGHPLCLTILADLWQERPFASADLPAFQGQFSDRAVMQWVQERILDKRMQPPYDDLARYGVLLRSFDLLLLRQVFPEWVGEGDAVFQRLIRYSFVIPLANRRYAFHDLLRQVQADYVRRQLPERWQHYHQRALDAWQQQPEQVFGQPLLSPDVYYHWLALDEPQAGLEWDSVAGQVAIIGEQDYWGRFLQAAHDAALAPGAAFAAARAYHQGRFFYYQARWDDALTNYQQALTLFRQVGSRLGEANTRKAIGDVQRFRDDLDAALDSYSQALTLFRQVGSRLGEANTLQAIGDVQRFRDDLDAALDSYSQALTLFRQVGSRLGEANTLQAIGDVQRFRDDLDAALDSYSQALTLFRQVGDRLGEANTRKAIGDVQQFRKDLDAALDSYSQALTLFRQVGSRLGEANCYLAQGRAALQQSEGQQALELQTQAYQLYQAIQDSYSQALALYYRSFTHQALGNLPLAIQDMETAVQIARRLTLASLDLFQQRLDDLRDGTH